MKKWVLCILIVLSVSHICEAQPTRYIIRLKDKANSPYSLATPSVYLSARAINRRIRYGIVMDSTDLPITPFYLDSIRLAGNVTILNASKWLNSVSIVTTDAAALAKINSFPFVQGTFPVAARLSPAGQDKAEAADRGNGSVRRENGITDFFNYGNSYSQVHIHNGEFLHNLGLRGEGLVIGMLDAGYQNYQTLRAFDSVRSNGQILGTWDFVAREASVNEDNAHGMQCFSTMAANIPGQFVGTAPKSSFYLFRTEDNSSEYPIEEHNWVCGAERLDSAGGDLISSSVGYTTFDDPMLNHTYSDLDGNTTMAARGADLAAKKGILVVNSAGNEGNKSWGKIVTPADADSVMAVGAVDATGAPAGFTSRGPSSDGRTKPDVASVGVGTVIQLSSNVVGTSNGTSFAAPNLAGLTACLWQGFQEFDNMRIIEALRRSGSKAAHPNDTTGYGVPDMKKAVLFLLKQYATASASNQNCQATVHWNSKDNRSMKYELERRVPGQSFFTKISEVNARGTEFGPQDYEFTDNLSDVPSGPVSYRIRQVIDTSDAGFQADYIDTASTDINTSCLSGLTDVSLMPNPTRGELKIKVITQTPADRLMIRIVNAAGQIVYQLITSKPAGVIFFDLPVYRFASGKYFVSVYDGKTKVATREVIKL